MKRRLAGLAGLGALAALLGALYFVSMPAPLEGQGRRFVVLALGLDRIEPGAVDAYFGPPDLRDKVVPAPTLAGLRADLVRLGRDVAADAPSPRRNRLAARVAHLIALSDAMAGPHAMSFDDQARRIFGVTPSAPDPARLAALRDALTAALPGPGALSDRLAAFRARFVIPPDRRKAVFQRALAGCRARTLVHSGAHWHLPPEEKLTVEWTDDVGAAWQRYQGDDRSLLQVNPDGVAYIGTALDVACHEAYPGHHAQFLLWTAAAPLPVEDTVVILRSPDQLLREGAANYGVDLAFPPKDRLAFQRDVLFPLAGFDPALAAQYVRVHALAGEMALAATPILRDFYDGRTTPFDAGYALERRAMIASPQALLQFTYKYGAYALGYSVARDLVQACVAARGKTTGRWRTLADILSTMDVSALRGGAC
ncbi:MAG: hypothetical protein H6924_04545 [Alphaproteobacteria bacterium]|nr:hypothetical protein [Alphaproteobacteria bacterium]